MHGKAWGAVQTHQTHLGGAIPSEGLHGAVRMLEFHPIHVEIGVNLAPQPPLLALSRATPSYTTHVPSHPTPMTQDYADLSQLRHLLLEFDPGLSLAAAPFLLRELLFELFRLRRGLAVRRRGRCGGGVGNEVQRGGCGLFKVFLVFRDEDQGVLPSRMVRVRPKQAGSRPR